MAAHVQARRQRVDGKEIVVITDGNNKEARVITPEQWDMLACADGTRTVEGIYLAAAGQKVYSRESAFRDLLADMNDAGLVEEGLETLVRRKPRPPPPTPGDRPVEVLPGYSLTCDLSGRCCGVYPSITFNELESARARALRPDILEGGSKPWHVFTPFSGSRPSRTLAVTMVDGNCAYLDPGGQCTLHALGGPRAKPSGCRRFPVTLCDDGQQIRVSIRTECPCTFASNGLAGGVPLVPETMLVADDLELDHDVVPENVFFTGHSVAPRAVMVAWSDALRTSIAARSDVVPALWASAALLEAEGPSPERVGEVLLDPAPSGPEPDELTRWMAALVARATAIADEKHTWRSTNDRCRIGLRLVTGAARRLQEPIAMRAALADRGDCSASDEQFYVAAALFGHHFLTETVAVALRDRAARVVLARALQPLLVREALTADAAHPLAIVDQMLRATGANTYIDLI